MTDQIFKINEDKLEYVAVPSTFLHFQKYQNQYESLFHFWMKNWEQEFSKNGNPDIHWKEHFRRNDFATGIFYEGEPITVLLCSSYDMRSELTQSSEYFHYIPNSCSNKLVEAEQNEVMTMEYLFADRRVRFNSLGVSLSKATLALSTLLGAELNQDANIGMPIAGTSVANSLLSLDGVAIESGIPKYGYELTFMAVPTAPRRPCKDTGVEDLANRLWEKRNQFKQPNEAMIAA